MITDKDIKKIVKANSETSITKKDLDKTSTLLIKEIFATKDEFGRRIDLLDEKFDNLQTSIDSYAKKSDTYFQEMLLLANKVDRQEKWIHQLAEKLGVQLKY